MVSKKTFVDAAEEDKRVREIAVKAFNIDDFAGKTTEESKVTIDGNIIKYKLLSSLETRQIKKDLMQKKGTLDLEEYGLAIVAYMMFKADGKTTVEKLDASPAFLVNKILGELGKASGFL